MKKRLLSIVLALLVIFGTLSIHASALMPLERLVILYENDVHCVIEGYSKFSALKDYYEKNVNAVGCVSLGDFIQGSSLGAISQGEYIVNIMNKVGYDAVALGNHEFDYKMDRLMELVNMMDTKPICANFKKTSDNSTVFEPYKIVNYGFTSVAYIGITTPSTITSSSPAQFKDGDDYIYSFSSESFYTTIQNTVNAAKAEGADHIVALAHLGTEYVKAEWTSQEVVKNTRGIDVVLDGHSHSVVEQMKVKNLDGKDVIISSTGKKFENIGMLSIQGNNVSTKLIKTSECTETDPEIDDYIKKINDEYSSLGNRKIGVSEVDLTTVDKDGNRIIRNAETNLGDFCADAYRIVTGSEIGLINGGGIRANIGKGDVTFNDILNVHPYNNAVVVVKATGKQIVDMLELGAMNYPSEDGSFQHVSGLTFNIDPNIKSNVKVDQNEVFISVDGEYRVHNVKVLNQTSGKYEPIDLNRYYTLCSHDYRLIYCGGGASMFKDVEVLTNDGMLDVELLEVYIKEHLSGVIDERYKESQNRIVIGRAANESVEDNFSSNTLVPDTSSPDYPMGESENIALAIALSSFALITLTKLSLNKKSK